MKIKTLLFLLVLSLAQTQNIFSQRIEGKTFTLFNYNMVLDVEFKQTISILESNITNPTYKGDKLSEAFTHITYAEIKDKLENGKSVFILPANSFQDKIKYDEYGYPQITIQKAIKKSDTRLFVKIYVFYKIESFGDQDDMIKPKVSIVVDFYNDLGYIPIKKFKAEAISDTYMKVNKEFLYGFDRKIKKENPDTKTLIDILNKAIDSIVEEI